MSIGLGESAGLGHARLATTVALAIHVVDEATHDFLHWYNPRARRIRRFLTPLPFPPTFTFLPWIGGLSVAVLALASLTPAAYGGSPWVLPIAYVLAVEHVGNGLVHVGGSLIERRAVPGLLSAPLMLATGVWLALAAIALP